jgi:prolyl 4-hydroxylase
MTTATALASLPAACQHWIKDNLARGCEPAGMAAVMVRDGRFDSRLARIAIEEVCGRSRAVVSAAPAPQAMPEVDTHRNTLLCAGREVQVLLSMQSPRVVLLGGFLSDQECAELAAYAAPRLTRSPVVGDGDGADRIHAHRTSRGSMLQRGECELVARIETRLAALTQWPVEHGEGLQMLRYEKGNEYRPHFDWFDPALPGPARHLQRGGQRLATVILYLSDVEQGGATTFPEAGLQIQPRRGQALFFANTDSSGRPDRRSLHAGEPVQAGVKLIATKWLRALPFL